MKALGRVVALRAAVVVGGGMCDIFFVAVDVQVLVLFRYGAGAVPLIAAVLFERELVAFKYGAEMVALLAAVMVGTEV